MSAGKTTAAMKHTGGSTSWTGAQANHLKVAGAFLEHIKEADTQLHAKWGLKWIEVPEEFACVREIFAHLATYLVETHLIEKGQVHAGKRFHPKTAKQC